MRGVVRGGRLPCSHESVGFRFLLEDAPCSRRRKYNPDNAARNREKKEGRACALQAVATTRRSCTPARCGTALQCATWHGHVARKSGPVRRSTGTRPSQTATVHSASPAGPLHKLLAHCAARCTAASHGWSLIIFYAHVLYPCPPTRRASLSEKTWQNSGDSSRVRLSGV